jgi:hypothetical protein
VCSGLIIGERVKKALAIHFGFLDDSNMASDCCFHHKKFTEVFPFSLTNGSLGCSSLPGEEEAR